MTATSQRQPDAVAQWIQLTRAAAALAEARTPTPCTSDPDAYASDDRGTRALAAQACTWCPLIDPCGRYALAAGHEHLVWGGVDLTPSHGQRSGHKVLAARHATATEEAA